MSEKIRLGELLIRKNLIDRQKLYKGLLEQKRLRIPLGEMLIRLNYVTEKDIHKVLSDQLNIPFVDLDNTKSLPDTITLVPQSKCRKASILPLAKQNGVVTLAMSNPLDSDTIEEIKHLTACEIAPVIASKNSIIAALDRFYSKSEVAGPGPEIKPLEIGLPPEPPRKREAAPAQPAAELGIIRNPEFAAAPKEHTVPATPPAQIPQPPPPARVVTEMKPQARVESLLDSIITDVTGERFLDEELFHAGGPVEQPSDEILLETDDTIIEKIFDKAIALDSYHIVMVKTSSAMTVRWYIDNAVIYEEAYGPAEGESSFNSVKTKASLFFSHTHSFSSGQFQAVVHNRKYDVRSTLTKTHQAELLSVHFQELKLAHIPLKSIGMSPVILKQFSRILAQRRGLCLFSGPFVSGKKTTIYSLVQSLATRKRVLTLEEKIRCVIPQAYQVEWRGTDETTLPYFVQNLAPDIVVVMFPLSQETLFKLAGLRLTLALTTQSSALEAFTHQRASINDPLTLELFLGALAQKRARLLCTNCRQQQPFTADQKSRYGSLPLEYYYTAAGCPSCQKKGTEGRLYLFELLVGFKNIHQVASQELSAYNRKFGGYDLKDDVIEKIKNGIISLDEAVRVLYF